ncbi:MAG: hypothetical protein IIC27_04310 [Chloroflexi bacterium]|nr:hypothetical protein [Chloroflexota bacterium]
MGYQMPDYGLKHQRVWGVIFAVVWMLITCSLGGILDYVVPWGWVMLVPNILGYLIAAVIALGGHQYLKLMVPNIVSLFIFSVIWSLVAIAYRELVVFGLESILGEI